MFGDQGETRTINMHVWLEIVSTNAIFNSIFNLSTYPSVTYNNFSHVRCQYNLKTMLFFGRIGVAIPKCDS